MSNKSKVLEALEADASETASEIALWRSFLEHPGWAKYSKLIEEQKNLRIGVISLQPLQGLSKVFEQEFMKGEANFAGTALTLPHTQLEAAQSAQRGLEHQIQKENDRVAETAASTAKRSRIDDQ